jgi:TPR repeat protein
MVELIEHNRLGWNRLDATGPGLPLGEALYWMAEKLAWGFEDVAPDRAEGLRLFRQAADLGFSDALIRIGQFQLRGDVTARDPNAALKSFDAAAQAGNFLAAAFLAKLLSRTKHLEQAEELWSRFFEKLCANPNHGFVAASSGELLHDYIVDQLRLGLEPGHKEVLQLYRLEIAGFHQRLLEHANIDNLDRLGGAMKWIELNLGPWPV